MHPDWLWLAIGILVGLFVIPMLRGMGTKKA